MRGNPMHCLLVVQQPLVALPRVVVDPPGGLIACLRNNRKGSEKPSVDVAQHHAVLWLLLLAQTFRIGNSTPINIPV